MSQTAIPNEFAKYMQNQISVGLAPDMNEMIFAHIPDLDPSQPIDPTQGLPSVGTWVHQQDIDQLGKLGDNALVYSTIIENDKEFTFNAIYLRDKNVSNSCGMGAQGRRNQRTRQHANPFANDGIRQRRANCRCDR
ncbi:hypothetical protein VAE016_370779 [Vibrio aestuarianus]|nr:hypothetical protein VAE016_370779 [Vibrio aestuarianus]